MFHTALGATKGILLMKGLIALVEDEMAVEIILTKITQPGSVTRRV